MLAPMSEAEDRAPEQAPEQRPEHPQRPRPVITQDNESFWEGVKQGELRVCGGDASACGVDLLARGASFEAAMDSLTARGVVVSPGWFRLYARVRGLPGNLKSGTYELRPNEDWGVVVRALKRGRGVEVRFTVPEGLMLGETADLAVAELASAEIALRSLRTAPAQAALSRAAKAAERARVPSLQAEVAEAGTALDRPAARRVDANREQTLRLADVEALHAAGSLVVDACRRTLSAGATRLRPKPALVQMRSMMLTALWATAAPSVVTTAPCKAAPEGSSTTPLMERRVSSVKTSVSKRVVSPQVPFKPPTLFAAPLGPCGLRVCRNSSPPIRLMNGSVL